MKKVREVLRLHIGMNLSSRQTHRAAGVPRTTVQDYVKRFKSSGLSIDEIGTMKDDLLQSKLFPEQKSSLPPKKPLPDMVYLHHELKQRKPSFRTKNYIFYIPKNRDSGKKNTFFGYLESLIDF